MNKLVREYGYINPGEDRQYYVNEGQVGSGQLIGIIVLDAYLPAPPGHVSNASTFDFPVCYRGLPEANQATMHAGEEFILPEIIKVAKELEVEGCRAIVGDCGYFGHFQKQVAATVDTMVYLSSVVMVPWIRVGLKPEQKIGVICGDGPHLTYSLFESCGVSVEDFERCIIVGAQDQPEFSKFDKNVGTFHSGLVRQELVGLAKKLVADHPDVGAILLECSDMPPYAASIQSAVNLPVFDYITMIKFLHSVVTQRPYGGYV